MQHLIAAVIGKQFIGVIGLYVETALMGRMFNRCEGPQVGFLNYLTGCVLQRKTVLDLPGNRIPAAASLHGARSIRVHGSYRGRSKTK